MTPDEMLGELDRAGLLEARPDLVRRFLVRAARLLAPGLPATAVDALGVAERHLAGAASDPELAAARARCWHLADTPAGEVPSPAVAALRAAICALYPVLDDAFESASFFFSMSARCGGPIAQQLALLEATFRDVEASPGGGADDPPPSI